ncbi:Hypothetical predicted protein [Cloeon dipterum]|uniref:SAGA-associated factor 11 homolog n=1 Tax=Cloeon dipterum TaxID=197152 RepID=A0A8S1C2T1_9INSE|nr:Hypothetical predicted protein [Cloeon dipterum]
MFKIILVWILLTFTCWGQHEYSVQNYLHHVKYQRVTSRNSRAVLTVSCWVVCGTDGGRRLLGTKPSTKWTRAGRARRPSSRRRGPMINMDELINQLSATILDDLIDDASLGVIFGVHRSNKLGYLAIEDGFKDNNGEHSEGHPIVIAPNMDVFGQVAIKNKQHECICPSCNRTLAASRFAPHLEKCMGMGRNSSRIASRRIANSSKEGNGNGNIASGTGVSDDDDDADWTFGGSEKKRKRKDKHSTKKKNSRVKNGGAAASTAVSDSAYNSLEGNISSGEQAAPVVNGAPTFESFGAAEKKTLLLQICGVVSEHTGKLCTRTLRCPQHSEEQRRNIRLALLGQNYEHNQVIGTYIREKTQPRGNRR